MADERLTDETPRQMIARLKSELQPEIPSCLPDPEGSVHFESDSRAVDAGLDIEPRLRSTDDVDVSDADADVPKPRGRIRRMLPKGIFGDGGDWYDIPEDQRKKTYQRLVLWGAIAIGIVGIAVVVYLQAMATRVPNVIGLTSSQAVEAIKGAGLAVGSIEERETPGVDPGIVVDQHPDVDSQLTRGSEVSITVSKAGSAVSVPNLDGLTAEKARAELTSVRLNGQIVTVFDDTATAGQVLGQVPTARTVVKAGASVAILVCAGPDSSPLTVPRVLGLSAQAASDVLTQQGFVPHLYTARSDLGSAGEVVAQIPGSGEQSVPGAAVQVLVTRAVTSAETEVPNVTGITRDEATAALAKQGLAADIVPVASESVAPGSVIAQMPLAIRCSVTAGEKVGLMVSAGSAGTANTPSILGMTLADAVEQVRSVALTPVVVLGANGAEPSESAKVTQQYPAVGAVARLGTPVVIFATEQ